MMLTELSGLVHIIDCTDALIAVGISGFILGTALTLVVVWFLQNKL